MRRLCVLSLVCGVVVAGVSPLSRAHGPTAGPAEVAKTGAEPADPSPEAPEVQRPRALDGSQDAQPGNVPAPAPEDPDGSPPGEVEPPATGDPAPDPDAVPAPTAVPAPDEAVAPVEPVTTPTPEEGPAIDETLLAPSAPDPVSPAVAPEPSPETVERALLSQYRPADNPGRLNLAVRGLFAYAGIHRSTAGGGRMGGVSADVGQSWNQVGYALSFTALGGRVSLADTTTVPALVGGGPTLGLGRLGMLGRGVLDFRVGYDFFWSRGTTEDLATGLSTTHVYAPHGPRVRLDMALTASGGRATRFWHAFGLSMGWQGLVHDIKGDFPFSSVLSVGLVYWMG